jgi:hypothetical protein
MYVNRRESERNFEIVLITAGVIYRVVFHQGMVSFKHAIVDLDICITGPNCSALEVACPPPGIGVKNQGRISEQPWNYVQWERCWY